MYNEMTTIYMEPLGKQGLSRPRTSWNSVSSPSSQSLSRVAPATPSTGSRLGAYSMPSYLNASPRSTVRKNDFVDVSDSDKQDIRLAFELYDTRKVCRLCYRELKAAMRALEFKVKKTEVQKLMHQFSKEDNDEIGHDEFMQIVLRKYKEKNPEVNVGKLFAVYDEESKGKISQKNLRRVARNLGRTLTDEQLEAMINEFFRMILAHGNRPSQTDRSSTDLVREGEAALELQSSFFQKPITYSSILIA